MDWRRLGTRCTSTADATALVEDRIDHAMEPHGNDAVAMREPVPRRALGGCLPEHVI